MFEIGKRPKPGERAPEPKRFDRPSTKETSSQPAGTDAVGLNTSSSLSGRPSTAGIKPPVATTTKEGPMKRTLDEHPGSSSRREGSLISAAMEIEGLIRSDEDVLIEGSLKGSITAVDSIVTIGPKGRVEADVFADTVVINGNMTGDVQAGELIAVRQSALVVGNLKAPRISIEDGSRLRGTISMEEHSKDSPFGSRSVEQRPISRRHNEERDAAPLAASAPRQETVTSQSLPAQEPGTLASN